MTFVICTPVRSSPIAASMRSRSCPARPTKGSPIRSSSAPGASPMNMTGAAGLPSINTVLVAVFFNGQSSKAATSAANSSIEPAVAARRRADCAASAKDSAKVPGGATGVTGAGGRATTGAGITGGRAVGTIGAGAGGASRFSGASPIASSAPISTYQRSSAKAALRSSGRAVGESGIGRRSHPRNRRQLYLEVVEDLQPSGRQRVEPIHRVDPGRGDTDVVRVVGDPHEPLRAALTARLAPARSPLIFDQPRL